MKLLNLAGVFALLAILAIGGGTAVLPEMQHMTVHQYGWLTDRQFRDIYSLGQVAPGPNMLMVLLIGYHIAGAAGALVVGAAFFIPDCILTLIANRLWMRFAESPWRTALRHGMAPIAIGLMLAGTYAIARLSLYNATGVLISIAVFAILLWRHVNPGLLVIAGGLAYVLLPHQAPAPRRLRPQHHAAAKATAQGPGSGKLGALRPFAASRAISESSGRRRADRDAGGSLEFQPPELALVARSFGSADSPLGAKIRYDRGFPAVIDHDEIMVVDRGRLRIADNVGDWCRLIIADEVASHRGIIDQRRQRYAREVELSGAL